MVTNMLYLLLIIEGWTLFFLHNNQVGKNICNDFHNFTTVIIIVSNYFNFQIAFHSVFFKISIIGNGIQIMSKIRLDLVG